MKKIFKKQITSKTGLFFDLSLLPLEISTRPHLRAVDPIIGAAIDMFSGNCKCRSIYWNSHLIFKFHPNTLLKSI